MEGKKQRIYSKKDLAGATGSIDGTPNSLGRGIYEYAEAFGIESFDDFRGKKVLDLGSGGAARFARGLEINNINAHVVSLSPAYKDEETRGRALRGKQHSSVSKNLVAAMGEQLPFRDKTFDRVVSHSVFEYVTGRQRRVLFLKEIIRVLKSGGVAYIFPIGDAELPRDYELGSVRSIFAKELKNLMAQNQCSVSFKNTEYEHYCMTIRKANA